MRASQRPAFWGALLYREIWNGVYDEEENDF